MLEKIKETAKDELQFLKLAKQLRVGCNEVTLNAFDVVIEEVADDIKDTINDLLFENDEKTIEYYEKYSSLQKDVDQLEQLVLEFPEVAVFGTDNVPDDVEEALKDHTEYQQLKVEYEQAQAKYSEFSDKFDDYTDEQTEHYFELVTKE
ncbi:hypothetical protein HHO41_04810 [Bacillus sp. DNRA2]|uniref:hypothetical protein n=1 Tax=Bacillus sp. DNRA2 TaxID=2723053 RepID=UPI00145F7D8E|nr:hypothetical protein [Bacillus sp. DNRA2]NMD69601.1 hypothetical protein [Bacillus sp. DNRA2]